MDDASVSEQPFFSAVTECRFMLAVKGFNVYTMSLQVTSLSQDSACVGANYLSVYVIFVCALVLYPSYIFYYHIVTILAIVYSCSLCQIITYSSCK